MRLVVQRLRPDGHVLELPVTAVMRDTVPGPQFTDDFDALDHAADALFHGDAEHGEFFGTIAEADAELEFSARNYIEERGDLGNLHRVVHGQEHDVCAKFEAFGIGSETLCIKGNSGK